MRKLLAALLLVALVLAPASIPADSLDYVPVATDHESLQDLGRALGCRGLIVYEVASPFNSLNASFGVYYGAATPVVRLIDAAAAPPGVRLMIFLHETAHCLQWIDGSIDSMPILERELDADLQAAMLACRMGLPGDRLLHDFFVWAHEKLGYTGDANHGTLAQRIAQGTRLAGMCRTDVQALLYTPLPGA